MKTNHPESVSKRPHTVLIEPFQGCNMTCIYCYSDTSSNFKMSETTLETVIGRLVEYLDEEGINQADIIWHGGEPLMAGIDFFRFMLDFCKKNGFGNRLRHMLQTNGTFIDNDWCRLIKENDISISISIDGPSYINSRTRTMNQYISFDLVMSKTDILAYHGIPYNFLVVVSKANCNSPEELYNFFSGLKRSFKINPIMKSSFKDCAFNDFGITAKEYGNFLVRLFDIWMNDENTEIRIGTLDTYIKNVAANRAFNCQHQSSCIDYVTGIKYDGSVAICSRFQDLRSGNVRDNKIKLLKETKPFSEIPERYLRLESCKKCEFLNICFGGCPNHAYSFSGNFLEKDYFCIAYKMIYSRIRDYIKENS